MSFAAMPEIARTALQRAEALAMDRARKAVRPIYRDKWLRPDHLGTCTFVEIDGRDFLVTAAHVIDNHTQHTLFVGQQKLMPITMKFHSTVPPGGERLRDKIDFAFAKVDSSWRDIGIEPLPLTAVGSPADTGFGTAIGFPNSRNRKYNPAKRTVRPTIRQYIGTTKVDAARMKAAGLDRDYHFCLNRDRKFARQDGRRIRAFEPRGMSGGTLFTIGRLGSPLVLAGLEAPLITPAAIITEKSEKRGLLFGTRLDIIVEAIRRTG